MNTMTDREAIEILQEEHRYCLEPCYVMGAIAAAISALKERIDRGETCKWCEEEWGTCDPITNRFTMPPKGGINYCPMCGRPLKAAMHEEDAE